MENLDVEEDSVLTSIFQDAFPKEWTSDPNFVHYLSDLSSFGVEKLAQEPDRLSEEKDQILQETQNLAFKYYKTFIQTAECSREIFEDFQIIEHHVEELLGKLPIFSEHCTQVLKKAQDITLSRRMNSLTLQRHTQLLEILELPQLMDTCVRNGYYDEALELAAHVKRLEKKHSAIPVIASIVNEVKTSSQLMLNQLIQQLRTNIQLPACLRVIGYLRRMDVFTELELRIKFLQARDSWFQGILETIPREDAYTHITKTIEASRVNLFDVITQYRAIFSDEDPLLSSMKETSMNEGALFHTWIVQKVSQFLSTLEQDLARGVGGRLDSILGQCMYFGLSFSRVGADFRTLLTPIFQQAALVGLRTALIQANKRFEESMRSFRLLTSAPGVSGLPYNPATSQAGQLYPPTVLLEFTPLAAFCNDILTALNELRLCSPVAIVTEVCDSILEAFLNVNKIILAFHRAEETTFDRKEKGRFDDFCTAYAHSLMPYINKCLQALYPPTQLAQVLGVTVSEMNKMGSIGQVDITKATNTIKHLVPEVEPEPVTSDPVQDPVSSATSLMSAASLTTQTSSLVASSLLDPPEQKEIADGSELLVEAPVPASPIVTPPTPEASQSDLITQKSESDQSDDSTQITEKTNQSETGKQLFDSETNQSEPEKLLSETVETKAESNEGLDPPKSQFTLNSDTEEEVDIDKALESMTGDSEVADDIDIESDLSALAADVLSKKPAEPKKKDD